MSAAEIIARGGVSLLEDPAVAVVLERCSSLRELICSRAADGGPALLQEVEEMAAA